MKNKTRKKSSLLQGSVISPSPTSLSGQRDSPELLSSPGRIKTYLVDEQMKDDRKNLRSLKLVFTLKNKMIDKRLLLKTMK